MRNIEQLKHAAEERMRGKESFFDTLIPQMSYPDAKDYEKGSIFKTRAAPVSVLLLVIAAVIALVW